MVYYLTINYICACFEIRKVKSKFFEIKKPKAK